MLTIGKLENKLVVLLLSFLSLVIIGIFDYLTSAELTLSIFYLIPIVLHALYKGTTKVSVIINSFVATLIWTLVMLEARYYSRTFYMVWNAAGIFIFFLTTGLLALYLNEKVRKINEMNQYLIQLNEEKNKFLGIAAHDLKNPIAAMSMCSEIILTNYAAQLTPDLSRIIGMMQQTMNSTLTLLTNLLDISVIESGKINVALKKQDYLDFVKQNMFLNQLIADRKEINIILETTETEVQLNFDEHYLSEVINNLLSNAVKYSYPKSEIVIKVSKTDKNSVLTEVIDKGKGIPEEEQIKLFNYFQMTSTRPTSGEKSTGLGLAIAKKIIQEHHGQIGVNSTVNVGSNFYYELNG